MRYLEVPPGPELSPYIRYFWIFEKKPEDTLFEREFFFPDVNTTLAFQIKGSIRVGTADGKKESPGGIAALAGAETSYEAHFPGEHLIIGVSLKPGAATTLGLFSPREIHGINSLMHPSFARVIGQCNDLSSESELPVILSPVQNLLSGLARNRSRTAKANPLSIIDKLPSFGSKINQEEITDKITLRQIERICLHHSGYTPRQCMALRACTTARKMIFTRNFSTLSDLALLLGFYDQAHFSRIFKKWYGMSPGEYNIVSDPYRNVMINENRVFTFS